MTVHLHTIGRVLLIGLTLLAFACGSEGDGNVDNPNSVTDINNNNNNTKPVGEVQRCENKESKSIDCPNGGCDQSCAGGGKCNFSCSGGNCLQTCAGGASCSFSCSGGGCTRNDALGALCN